MIILNFNEWHLQGFQQGVRSSSCFPSFCKHFEGYVISRRKGSDFLYLYMRLADLRQHSHRLPRLNAAVVLT